MDFGEGQQGKRRQAPFPLYSVGGTCQDERKAVGGAMNRAFFCPWLVLAALALAGRSAAEQPGAGREATLAAEAFAQGRFQQALEFFRPAIEAEQRLPYRRQMIARAVLCYQALGQLDLAGETFLLLVHDDPATPHFGCIPLAWLTDQPSPSLDRAARNWLARIFRRRLAGGQPPPGRAGVGEPGRGGSALPRGPRKVRRDPRGSQCAGESRGSEPRLGSVSCVTGGNWVESG